MSSVRQEPEMPTNAENENFMLDAEFTTRKFGETTIGLTEYLAINHWFNKNDFICRNVTLFKAEL